jgi:hypothetical protein
VGWKKSTVVRIKELERRVAGGLKKLEPVGSEEKTVPLHRIEFQRGNCMPEQNIRETT